MMRALNQGWLVAVVVFLATGAPAHADGADGQAAGFQPLPIEAYGAIIARPLFAPDRRPYTAPAEKGSAASVGLTGVVLLPGARYAMIKDGASPTRSVPEGASIAAGIIEKITADGIILRRVDGHAESIRVFETDTDKKAAPDTTPAAATTVAPPHDMTAPSHSSRPVIATDSR